MTAAPHTTTELEHTLAPSRPRRMALLALPVLSTVGIGISAYLTYVRLAHAAPLCTIGGCETVNASPYAAVGGIPIAVLGMGLYSTVFVLGLVALRGPAAWLPWALLGIFGLALSGVLYSVYLTYIELFVLEAICPWCVTSAATVTAICGVSGWSLLRPPTGQPG